MTKHNDNPKRRSQI